MLLVPIYTRIFQPDDYGRIDTLTTSVAFLSLITSLGLDTAVALYFYDNKDASDRASMITTSISIRVILSSAVALIVTLLAPFISEQLFQSPEAKFAVQFAAWAVPANAVVGSLINLLRLDRRPWAYSIITVTNLLLGVFLSIFFVVYRHWGMTGAFAGPLFSNLIILPVGLWMTRQMLTTHVSHYWVKILLHIGLPLVPAAFSGWLLAYANRYFLLYYGSPTAVGLLAVGNKVSAPLVLFATAFRIAWAPFAFSLQQQSNAHEVYAKTLTYFCLLGGGMAVLIGIFAREALILFTTPDYVAGHIVAGVMAFQIIADTCYHIIGIGATLAKKTYLLAYSVPIAALCSLGFNWLLIPHLGFFGAALANALSYVFLDIITYKMTQKAYTVPYEISKILRFLMIALVTWVVGIQITPEPLWLSLVFKMLLMTAFGVCLLWLRIVTITDLTLGLSVLKQLGQSVRQRLSKVF